MRCTARYVALTASDLLLELPISDPHDYYEFLTMLIVELRNSIYTINSPRVFMAEIMYFALQM